MSRAGDKILTKLRDDGQALSFAGFEQLSDKFESVLIDEFGISISRDSQLEAACLSIKSISDKHTNSGLRRENVDIRKEFTEALGIWGFMTKVVRHRKRPELQSFREHLLLLNEGTVGQNTKLHNSEEASNKIFELLIALTLVDVAEEINLDDPTRAVGDNPDILATIAGKRWGFACKTFYSANNKTIFDNIKKGIDQIEKSEAQVGVVVGNFKNLIDHSNLWPKFESGTGEEFGAVICSKSAARLVASDIVSKIRSVTEEIGEKVVESVFAERKALPGVLGFAQFAIGVATAAGPTPSVVSLFAAADSLTDGLNSGNEVFVEMNEALHERR